MPIQIDFEVTNRCNAKCEFCPRDLTPHEGLMSPEVFEAALQHAVEYRALVQEWHAAGKWITDDDIVNISLCGLGEPLLHPRLMDYLKACKAEGFFTGVSSNGSVLSEKKGRALIDAGLDQIALNIADQGERYEEVYQLPWERTRENVERFAQMSKGTNTGVVLVLVDYRNDDEHMKAMAAYWRERGIHAVMPFEIMNRGGALFVDEMQYPSFPEVAQARTIFENQNADVPRCLAPFAYPFVGYDGLFYLCCSDWRKQAPMGSVFEHSIASVIEAKLEFLETREPVCINCNHDPLNRVADGLRDTKAGHQTHADVTATIRDMAIADRRLAASLPTMTNLAQTKPKKLIPVTAN